MLKIPVPTPNTNQIVSLGGVAYKLKFDFNSFDESWRISIYKSSELVLLNIKVTGAKSLVRASSTPVGFAHGDLQVHQVNITDALCGKSNFGIGKDYELYYFSNEELTS